MPRCLIVERHRWETGGREQQIQLPLNVANAFFGSGAAAIPITVKFVEQGVKRTVVCSVSRIYMNRTRRINGLRAIGRRPACFIFFQETKVPRQYDMWWQTDTAIVAARYSGWRQGRNSQHGRGRLVSIQDAPVPRVIDTI